MYYNTQTIHVMDAPTTQKQNVFQEFLTFAFISLIIVVPIRLFIAQPFIVSGESMDPTFATGQYLIVDQLSYRFENPARGDVVIFRYPKNPSTFFIKRIIGLPGETVEIIGSDVFVTTVAGNRIQLKEPYITHTSESFTTTTLASDEYYVMGDNRAASLDSRIWGPLKRDHITGKAYLRLLPLDTAGFHPGSI